MEDGDHTYWEHIRIIIAHLQKSFWSGTGVFRPLKLKKQILTQVMQKANQGDEFLSTSSTNKILNKSFPV